MITRGGNYGWPVVSTEHQVPEYRSPLLVHDVPPAGLTFVVDVTGPKGKIVAENQLGETILCTPAIASDSVFVRSNGFLWKISR